MLWTTFCRPGTVGPLSSVLVLDTHVWVKFVAGVSLSKRARATRRSSNWHFLGQGPSRPRSVRDELYRHLCELCSRGARRSPRRQRRFEARHCPPSRQRWAARHGPRGAIEGRDAIDRKQAAAVDARPQSAAATGATTRASAPQSSHADIGARHFRSTSSRGGGEGPSPPP
jgi:hypothetical protein